MTRTPLLIILAAAAALAGCNKENHTIVAGGPDVDDDTNAAANAPVALPPSIASSKSYRCKDNSLVYVDWLSDGTRTREEQRAMRSATARSLPARPISKGDAKRQDRSPTTARAAKPEPQLDSPSAAFDQRPRRELISMELSRRGIHRRSVWLRARQPARGATALAQVAVRPRCSSCSNPRSWRSAPQLLRAARHDAGADHPRRLRDGR